MGMSDARLETILESYGAAPERWPTQQQADALALLGRSDRARRRWVEAAALDLLMQQQPAPDPSEALLRRLKAIPTEAAAQPRRPVARSLPLGPKSPLRRPLVGALAASVLAFLVGLALPAPFGGPAPEPPASASAEGADSGIVVATTEAVFAAAAADDDIAIVDTWSADAETLDDNEETLPELAVLDLALD